MYRKNGLQHTFLKLKESNSSGDFPKIMANVAHKALIKGFSRIPSPWKQYAKIGDLTDFKTHSRAWTGEFSDWLQKAEDKADGYQEGKISEHGYDIALGTYGRTFMLTRKMVINDDLGAFTDAPDKIGRAGGRTLAKQVAQVLNSNPNAFDGSPLFGTRNSVANFGHSVPLSADATGIANLQTGITAIRNAKDPGTGEKLGLEARYLIVPSELELIAKWLVSASTLTGSTSSVASVPDAVRRLEIVVDPWLTFTSRWYLCADPADAHFVEVGFLNGRQEPEVFVKKSESVRVGGGGADDFGYDYDDMEFKGRLDWAVAPAMYQAVYMGK